MFALNTTSGRRTEQVLYLVVGNDEVGHIKPFHVFSPDRSKQVQIDFVRGENDAVAGATIITPTRTMPLHLHKEWAQVEVLWSPDSRSVALTGAFNAYTNSTEIFQVNGDVIKQVQLTTIQMDMARTYPPCKASNADPDICHREQNGQSFNYATIAWSSSTSAVIMSEIPCSSSHGGTMCQIEGYEVDIRTGHILQRMTAKRLKTSWQEHLAWEIRIPTPPIWKYGPAKEQGAEGATHIMWDPKSIAVCKGAFQPRHGCTAAHQRPSSVSFIPRF